MFYIYKFTKFCKYNQDKTLRTKFYQNKKNGVDKMKKILFSILFFLQTIMNAQGIDTLKTVDDGVILNYYTLSAYGVFTKTNAISVGDGLDWYWDPISTRGFLTFNIQSLEDREIKRIDLKLYQTNSTGNDILGQFPTFGVKQPGSVPCIIDHIIYGDSLGWEDWNAGDKDDEQTIKSVIGIISDDTTKGWKTLNITDAVLADLQAGRTTSQFRLRFIIDYDNDLLSDFLSFNMSKNEYFGYKRYPHLLVTLNTPTTIDEETFIPVTKELSQNYPNPFNPTTLITYTIPTPGHVILTVFDALGQEVAIIVNSYKNSGKHSIQFDGQDLPSGIYIYSIKAGNFNAHKKMLLLR